MDRTGSRPPKPGRIRPHALSCTALEWERARELACERGISISRLLVTAALNPPAHLFNQPDDKFPPKTGHPSGKGKVLALTTDEQRALYDAVLKLTDGGDAAMLPTPKYSMNMQDCIRYLFETKVADLVDAGRGDDIYRLFGKILNDPVRREQVRRWVETRR